MINWLKSLFEKPNNGSVGADPLAQLEEYEQKRERMDEVAQVDGGHYTDSVERVKQLKREGRHEEAIEILLKTVEATEKESEAHGGGWGVAPWYYEQLAIIYRNEGRIEDEIKILERYGEQEKAVGAGPVKLSERLKKARALLNKRKT